MHKRAKLWSGWLAPTIGALIAATVIAVVMRPSNSRASEEFSIALGTLHSQVAEARLLAEHAARDELTQHFVAEHAAQIEDRMHDAIVDVGAKGRPAGRVAMAAEAASLGASAVASLGRVAARPDAAAELRAAQAALVASERGLSRLESAVQAGGR